MPFASSIEGKVAFGRGGISVIPLAGSLFFNGGATTYLKLTDGVAFGGGAYTIECWFYNSANWTDANRGFLGGGPDGVLGCMSLFITAGNNGTSITTDRYSSGEQRNYTVAPISVNAWHYFTLVRNASLVETIFIDGVKATGAAGGTSVFGGQQVNSLNYSGLTRNICNYYQGRWTGYITNMRMVVGTAVYDPTASTMTVPNKAPLTVIPNTKYLMLGAVVTTDSSSTQTVTNNLTTVTQISSIKPF